MLSAAGAAAVGLVAAAVGTSGPGTQLAGCPMFPAANAWNRDVSRAPVDPRSDAYVRSIGLGERLHPDFASRRYGIPFSIVPQSQRRVPIRFTGYGDESDPGPYPIPAGARVEGGSDRHVIVLQRGTCRLYELFGARRTTAGWDAASGATFDLRSNALRPSGWTSADAAGLPIYPGLVTYEEVKSGEIDHAIRVTFDETRKGYISPATHYASSSCDPDRPPMGLRLRLKEGYDLSGFSGDAKVIATALKRYGVINADNGSNWFISGSTDRRWDDENLNQLKSIPGSAFEVVRSGPETSPC